MGRTQPKAMSQTFRKEPSKLDYRSGEGRTLGREPEGQVEAGNREKAVEESMIMEDISK